MIEIDKLEALKEAVKANPKVVVDFFATWCPPCKFVPPILDTLAKEEKFADVKFYKYNIDGDSSWDDDFVTSIRAIPTVIVFRDGKAVLTHTGVNGLEKTLKEFDLT